MFKKDKEHEGEVHEATKTKEETAYEDSWYRSLKALADMRPTEDVAAAAPPTESDEEAGAPED
jgi:hypothetical protein